MGKTLVIAEKPSVGRDIGRVLKCGKKIDGALEGSQYIVTWGLGHLVTLADPEHYDKKYKDWKMEDLPMLPEKMDIEVIKQTGKQYQAVKRQIYRKDVSDIVIATDAGREGELVARWILKKADNHKPCKRLWISSVTDKAIRQGFEHLKNAKEYDNLYHAAVCRAEADWLVGLNATRVLTCKYNAQLSCGRVQTPTLAMIAKREEEIRKFVPKPYYGLQLQAEGVVFTWKDEKSGSYRSFQKERIANVQKKLSGKKLQIIKADTKVKKQGAPQLYDLTQLQREANQKFGFSAKETLNIMQRLYENHKVLTYPRTDSRYLTADVMGTIKERLQAINAGVYREFAAPLLRRELPKKPAFVNDAKVSDHHAIIPTEQAPNYIHMSNEERKIYDMVVRRFLAVMYPAYEYEESVLTGVVEGEHFYARGTRPLHMGWKAVYENQSEDEEEEELKRQNLPVMQKGQEFSISDIRLTEGKTKPPARFTEGTLIAAMENPVRYMESSNKEMAKTLGETGGLGTVATRADIIEKLFSGFLLEKKGEDIYTTAKARQLLELVPEDLRKPELTAQWEMKLSKIAEGKLSDQKFMTEIRTYSTDLVKEIKTAEGTFRHDNMTNKLCPNCGKRLLAVNGKNSRMLVCQDRECGYRQTIAKTTNARCPQCHKRMELIGSGENASFVCKCGYKERLSKFQERRKKEGAGVSKRDVQNYLKKQQKEAKQETGSNAMLDALKNIKL
ncbi:DNA topoisomerase III [uncultured Eubacterium sp.]|uniref:DNA topoisomerase III n=1 Tax=uncultured Eubacterium sp. TaxID=165185 RepID=UPI00259A8545|nr:DNA topoisomerase III [uncultured Eubacterium sp.]